MDILDRAKVALHRTVALRDDLKDLDGAPEAILERVRVAVGHLTAATRQLKLANFGEPAIREPEIDDDEPAPQEPTPPTEETPPPTPPALIVPTFTTLPSVAEFRAAVPEAVLARGAAVGWPGLHDYDAMCPWRNRLKSGRDPLHKNGGGKFALDRRGYPIGASHEDPAIVWLGWSGDLHEQNYGRFYVRWDGAEDAVAINGWRTERLGPNVLAFDFTFHRALNVEIRGPVDNLSLVAEHDVEAHDRAVGMNDALGMIRPEIFRAYEGVKQIRWMDPLGTNSSKARTPDDIRPLDALTWKPHLPIEVPIAVCNALGADMWLNTPHLAHESYVRHVAAKVRDGFDPARTVYSEFSNEIFNYARDFRQSRDLDAMAEEDWGIKPASYQFLREEYGVKLATEAAAHWRDEVRGWPGATIFTLGGRAGLRGRQARAVCVADKWREAEPDAYVPPSETFGALCIATYIDGKAFRTPEIRDAILALWRDGKRGAAVNALVDRLLFAEAASVQSAIANWTIHRQIAHGHGMKLLAYEGNTHILATAGVPKAKRPPKDDVPTLIEIVNEARRMPRFAELWASWVAAHEAIDGPVMHFVMHGPKANRNGDWSIWTDHRDLERPEAWDARQIGLMALQNV